MWYGLLQLTGWERQPLSAIHYIMPKLPYDVQVILQKKIQKRDPTVQSLEALWAFLFSRYETRGQRTALDELYSFTQKAGEVAITLRVRLEAINERVQAEGAYFGEDKLVCHFVRGLQQPF